MKNLLLVFTALICFAKVADAQKSKLVGSWLMIKAEVEGEVQKPYFITEFKVDGNFLVMGIEAGTWAYDKANNAVVMKSELDKDFNGEGKIIKLTDDKLELDKDGANLYYKKVDESKIAAENKESGLLGMWEFKDVPYSEATTLVTFTQPDEFTMIQKQEGSIAKLNGTWIFDKQSSELIMIGLRGEDTFNGENKIVKINEENLELENSGTVFSGNKKAQSAIKIERLTYDYDEFFTEDGDFKYDADVDKLPWQDPMEMMMKLVNLEQLVYKYSTLIEGTDAFEDKTLTADINSNPQEQELSIDFIFSGYDRYSLPEDAALPQNEFDEYNRLYPEEDNSCRIVGSEQITTTAGTFDCVVVEVAIDYETRKKLWMIKDKPGIYAKIIDDKEGTWGHYNMFELQEIK